MTSPRRAGVYTRPCGDYTLREERSMKSAKAALGVVLLTAAVSGQETDHATSREFNRALGVECGFCHAPSGRDDPAPRATARRMVAMVSALNGRLAEVRGRVTCWTCHSGQRVPARLARTRWQQVLEEWPTAATASEEVRLTMAVYTASVGRRCAGCHDGDGTGPVTEEAAHLVRTMNGLFPVMKEYLPAKAQAQCFMCHKGRPHPQTSPID